MKSHLFYAAVFLWIMLFTVQAQAAESYCSLNDGMKADGKTVLHSGGVKHEFCCSGCLEKFKENPEKFSKQIEQPELTSPAEAEAACSSVCSE